jgi:hypothetical protein
MTQIRFYGGLALALALGVAIALFGGHYRKLQIAAQQNEQRGSVLETTSAGVADTVDIDKALAENRAALAANRNAFQKALQEAKRNEPETAARAVLPVPDSVRTAYRERRLARERLGCAGRQCRQDDQADAASQR